MYQENLTNSKWAEHNINPLLTSQEDMQSVVKMLTVWVFEGPISSINNG